MGVIPSASVLATWPEANYINPVTRGNENVVLNIVLYTLLVIFIGLRIVTRTAIKKAFGADDVLIILALIPTTIFFVLSILADTKYLWTRHQYDIPGDQVETGLKMVMCAEISFAAACTLTKLSMLSFSHRLLALALPTWRRIIVVAMVIVALQGSVFCLVVIFQCIPVEDYWKIFMSPQTNCISQTGHLLAAGIINTFTDFLVVLLPIRMVLALQLPRRTLLWTAVLFAMGFLSCFAGIARTYYLYITTTTDDQIWAAYPVWMTAAIELYVGVICASIPATRPLFTAYLPKIFGSMSGTQPSTPGQSRARPTSNATNAHGNQDNTEEDLQDLISALEKSYGSPGSKFSSLSRMSQQDALKPPVQKSYGGSLSPQSKFSRLSSMSQQGTTEDSHE